MVEIISNITDGQQIIAVIHAAFKRYEQDPMPSSALAETAATIKQELEKGVVIVGAETAGQLVGVVKVTCNKDTLYFSRLAVLPDFQGKGIASTLVKAMEHLAIKEQVSTVYCKVRKSEEGNIHLYEKLGYHISKEEQTTSPLGFVMETVTMEKVMK